MSTFTPRSQRALGLLLLAKVVGIVAIVLAFTGHRTLGGILLGCDGVLLVATIAIAARGKHDRASVEIAQKEALAQMIREGKLEGYLEELKGERRADT